MNKNNSPIVSKEELEALISGWQEKTSREVDAYFPLRIWFLILVAFSFAVGLLLNSSYMAFFMADDPELNQRLLPFLYFRGWFIVVFLIIGIYSYLRNWRTSMMFTVMTVVACVNLVSDLYIVYPERLAEMNPGFAFLLAIRLLSIYILYLCAKNASRIPNRGDRLNLLLPLQNTLSRSAL